MAETPKPASILEVFYSYAGEDEALRNVLEKHLSMIQHQGFIASWSYRKISAGAELASEVNAHLNRAQIILLLVSADFLSSDYCYGVEMQRAMERHNAGEAHVIPILLRPVDYAGAPFNKLEVLPANGKAISLWRDRDEAFTNVAKGIRKAVEAFNSLTQSAHLPSQSLSFTAVGEGPGRIWNVPFRRNPFFTGREDILIHLYKQFHQGKSEALIQAQALTGLGGIGKTQIAVEYAYRYQQDYRAVLWVNADSHEALNSDFLTIADVLQLPEKNARDQRLIVAAVKRWLEQSNDWLLILDNADEVAMVQDFLPTTNKGHILLTTRARWLGTIAQGVELNIMEQEEGALLLLRRAHILPADVTLSRASATDRSQSSQLVAELGGLPLALDHAGAYIEETSTDLSHYLDLYQTRRQVLLNRRSKMPNNHPEPVAATWALAFRRVEQDNPPASELLRICAFLHPDSIPVELIASGASDLGTVLESVARDPWQLDESIGELQRFSLVRRHADTNTLSIHRLVQAVLKDEMDAQMQQQRAERAVRVVNRGFPFVEMSTWPQCQRYLPHALVCADSIERFDIASAEAARLLHQTGNYLMERAQYPEAEPLYKRALAIKEKVVGPAHPSTAMTLNNLANLYTNQGKYGQAEPLLQRALAIYERLLKPDHLETASTLNNLANLYTNQGKYEQAEPLLQRALAIYERVLGTDHLETASTLNNLANLYLAQWKYEQAEPLLQRALAIKEKVGGPDHPDTAMTLNNLANLFTDQREPERAEPLYQRALSIYERALGPEHPSIAMTLNNLANLYADQDKDEQAEPLLQRALAIYERTLGPEHPDTAMAFNNLALLYEGWTYKEGKREQAEPLLQRALAIYEKVLGTDHPDTAGTINNLANFYMKRGKYEQAELSLQRALKIYEQALPQHPDTVLTYNNLANLYMKQGKYEQAESLLQRAQVISERTMPDHLATAITFDNLANLFTHQGQYEKASTFRGRARYIRQMVLGSDHLPAARVLKNYLHLLPQMELFEFGLY